jgi:hypothetical protein
MALSMRVCKCCCGIHNSPWVDVDDDNWGNDMIACPVAVGGSGCNVSKSPPAWCEFRLEHLMDQQPELDPKDWAKFAKAAGAKSVDFPS